jgi:alpha-1,2-glucosyltransferase
MFRQTNIIWTFWIALNSVIEWFEREQQPNAHIGLDLVPFIFFVKNRFAAILVKFYGYILVAVAFVTFVFVNNGLVVGDRTNHIAITHVPQILYFSAFCVLFMGGEVIVTLWRFYRNKSSVVSLMKHIALPMLIGIPIAAFIGLRFRYVILY